MINKFSLMKTAITTLFVCLSSLVLVGQEVNTPEHIKSHLDKLVNENNCKGIAVGAYSPDFKWSYKAGMADDEKKIPFNETTLVRTASITKPITAIAVMQLVEQGKLDLEAPVSTYLSSFNTSKFKDIKVKHILQHSSGLRGYKNNKERNNKKNFTSLEDAFDIVSDSKLLFEPGSDFQYTSYGYNVAGLLIEHVSGWSYDDYIKKFIFEPAGMASSTIERAGQVSDDVAKIYHQNKPGKIKLIKEHNISDRIPAGGVLSTIEDLVSFGKAVLDYRLISKESLDSLITNTGLKKEGNGYGMGWYLYGMNPKYGNIFGHSGGQLGCSSFIFLFPQDEAVTVVLSNTSNVDVGPIGFALRDLIPDNKE